VYEVLQGARKLAAMEKSAKVEGRNMIMSGPKSQEQVKGD